MKESLEKIKSLCLEALTTDGAHHKQWYLEAILKETGCDISDIYKDYEWEKGALP